MKYIDADRLQTNIKEIEKEFKTGNYYLDNSEQAVGYYNALMDFEQLILSLQQEQPEVYLNENTLKKEFCMIDSACLLFNYDKLSREQLIARRFYQLGLKARKED